MERDKARSERDFWKGRYETQHRKVHEMEDLIARYREALVGLIAWIDGDWEVTGGGHIHVLFKETTPELLRARRVLSDAENQEDRP
jgi:hypothetical protein